MCSPQTGHDGHGNVVLRIFYCYTHRWKCLLNESNFLTVSQFHCERLFLAVLTVWFICAPSSRWRFRSGLNSVKWLSLVTGMLNMTVVDLPHRIIVSAPLNGSGSICKMVQFRTMECFTQAGIFTGTKTIKPKRWTKLVKWFVQFNDQLIFLLQKFLSKIKHFQSSSSACQWLKTLPHPDSR